MAIDTGTFGVITIAGIMASAPYGIPMEHIALGTSFAILGVGGRAAFELQKAFEDSGNAIKVSKILGWVGSGLIGAPFVTIMYLIVLRMAGVQSDGIVSLGLLFLGFSGPRMVSWLLNTAISLINKKTGFNLPSLGATQTQPGTGAQPSQPQGKGAP